ncbi:MAG: TRAP transporter substrate-binding protein [Betaproteobacteria bacterium]|nr:TRAP transporter substrate-binding protein [Betaproteobacteria bacterium]MDH5221157.1 TRAP transporter substrate-binding protein [Betaproteobacteria bacterium]MDH5350397.1 TRAP transporter substrate-binding protein [Betaproteobacteria bacterium]
MKSRIAVLLAASFAFGMAQAQTKWDMPTPYSDGEFHTRNVVLFAEDVAKRTGGALEIKVHANGSLIKHPDILRAVSTGQVNVAEFLLGQFGNEDPVFAADNVPFVATGYDNAKKFYDAQKPLLARKLADRGMTLLFSVPWPGQGIYTKDPLKSVEDLKGTKFRTYSPLTARLAELLGASPTVIQVPEIPQMFATGAVQAMITSSATGTSTKAWEFVKNYYKTSAFHPKNVVVVNTRALKRLPKAQQDALIGAAQDAEPRGWAMSKQRERDGDETLARNGMTLHEPSAEMKAAFAKVGAQMAKEWEAKAGADGQAILKAYRK